MDISPYHLVHINSATDAFVLSPAKKKFNRLYRVFFPLLLLMVSLVYLFLYDKSNSPAWLNWLPLLMSIIAILILTTKYAIELRFNTTEIKLIQRNAFWRSSVKFPVKEQKHLAAEVIQDGFLYVINQQFNKVTIFTIPKKDIKQSNITSMLGLLSEKTGLPIIDIRI